MEANQVYVLIAIAALLIIAIVIFFLRKDKKHKPLTPLSSFSLLFVLAGIIFGDNRILGYSLIGLGIVLAIIDIFVKKKKK